MCKNRIQLGGFGTVRVKEIRSKTISYSAWKKKHASKVESSLENEIKDLTDKVSQGDSTSVDLLNSKQAELVDIRKNKMDGVLTLTVPNPPS